MELNDREKLLIQNALFILECQCLDDGINYDIKQDLIEGGGVPDVDEIRALINKIR
jgi:hypothetical protein